MEELHEEYLEVARQLVHKEQDERDDDEADDDELGRRAAASAAQQQEQQEQQAPAADRLARICLLEDLAGHGVDSIGDAVRLLRESKAAHPEEAVFGSPHEPEWAALRRFLLATSSSSGDGGMGDEEGSVGEAELLLQIAKAVAAGERRRELRGGGAEAEEEAGRKKTGWRAGASSSDSDEGDSEEEEEEDHHEAPRRGLGSPTLPPSTMETEEAEQGQGLGRPTRGLSLGRDGETVMGDDNSATYRSPHWPGSAESASRGGVRLEEAGEVDEGLRLLLESGLRLGEGNLEDPGAGCGEEDLNFVMTGFDGEIRLGARGLDGPLAPGAAEIDPDEAANLDRLLGEGEEEGEEGGREGVGEGAVAMMKDDDDDDEEEQRPDKGSHSWTKSTAWRPWEEQEDPQGGGSGEDDDGDGPWGMPEEAGGEGSRSTSTMPLDPEDEEDEDPAAGGGLLQEEEEQAAAAWVDGLVQGGIEPGQIDPEAFAEALGMMFQPDDDGAMLPDRYINDSCAK